MSKLDSKTSKNKPKNARKRPKMTGNRNLVTILASKNAQVLPKYVFIKAGLWYVRRNFPTAERDKNGRIIYTQIARLCHDQTEEAAKYIAAQIESEIIAPRIKSAIFSHFLAGYLDAKRPSISQRTFEATQLHLNRLKQLLPMPIDEIKPMDIQAQYKALNATPFVIKEIHKKLSSAFNRAIQWELIGKNPCKAVILPKVPQHEVTAFTLEQAKTFIAECKKTDENIVLEFALETGMRPSEYLALRWSDVSGNVVKVRRALVVGLAGGGFDFNDCKTKGSRRDVQISPELKQRLEAQKKRRAQMKRDLSKRIRNPPPLLSSARRKKVRKVAREMLKNLDSHNLVFPSDVGLPQSINNLNRRDFKGIVTAIGLDEKEFSLYCLRHTSITIDLIEGADVKTVAANHGTSAEMIWKTYAHALPKQRDEATVRKAAALY